LKRTDHVEVLGVYAGAQRPTDSRGL